MKKVRKIELRLLIVLAVCMLFSIGGILLFHSLGIDLEDFVYSRYMGQEESLGLKQEVYVLTIDTSQDDNLTTAEKEKINREYQNGLRYLVSEGLIKADGIFILGTDLLKQPSTERTFLSTFRNAKNVFWRYNNKNLGYYHEDDRCGQIDYMDAPTGNLKKFSVIAKAKYAKNYLPYYMMTMHGEKVRYDSAKQRLTVKKKTGGSYTLYTSENGMVTVHKTAKYNVKYLDFQEFYQKAIHFHNPDQYAGAVFFIQDNSNDTSVTVTNGEGETQDLADYYIDVLGTIENEVSIPSFSILQKILVIFFAGLLLGVVLLFLPVWAGAIVYVAEIVLIVLANILLYDKGIYYVPIVGFIIFISGTFIVLCVFKQLFARLNMKNLPIDAVIRFSDAIINIDHSVSYSEYLMKNRSEIEQDLSASLLLPVMDKNSFMLKELAAENHRNKKFVETEFWNSTAVTSSVVQVRSNLFQGINYIAFVPLPVFDLESEKITYTAIGLRRKLKTQNASYISLMLFSMYIYFKAQHERGEHQRMYFSMLSLMISVIDAKDPVTAGHSQRVASISKDIGIWLKLSKSEQYDLEFTALLHDIGKIGVSDYVLNKPSVYTQNDFEQMKFHTIRGSEMLSEVGISKEIIDGVRHHHERIDGKGYPDGLKGDQLSLFAKIIKIADVFDALTSKRRYKEAWEIEKALNIIYLGRGTEFDSDIADVFIEHMCPPGWIPPVSGKKVVEKVDVNTDKSVRIACDFYEKYSKYISVEYPIPSRGAMEVDFNCRSGFMHFDWGETFNNAQFLEKKPMILSFENETKSLLFGQTSKDSGVSSIYYYFFKGFVNLGAFLLVPSKVNDILLKLTEIFGEPQIINDQLLVHKDNKMRVVFYHTVDDKFVLFYISDYLCANYFNA